jgi:Fe-S cluster assembly ATP-binding protein
MSDPGLHVEGLHAGAAGHAILHGIDLDVEPGRVHAVMGPNGSGKSTLAHVLMGRPGYEITAGRISIGDIDLTDLPPAERAQAGLFLALQYPIEVPGVHLDSMFAEALRALGRDAEAELPALHAALASEAARIGFGDGFLARSLNVDLSGGEQKRNEVLQLSILRPVIAILDEIDSGLDVDALRQVSARIEAETRDEGSQLGVLAITHYPRLLHVLVPDVVHVMVRGRIVATGGPELAEELERTGYVPYGVDERLEVDDRAGQGAGNALDQLNPADDHLA